MLTEKLAAASTFLLQSPPGEVNDCFNDVRTLVGDDRALEQGILPALATHNLRESVVVQLERQNVLITAAARVFDSARFLDPRRAVTFEFDHMSLIASDPQPIATHAETEALRDGLDQALSGYVTDCYHDGVCAVYALPDPNYPAPVPVPAPEPVTAEEPPTNDSEQVAEENEIEAEQDQPVVEEDAKAGESEGVGEPAVEPAMEPTTAGPTELAEEGGKELSAEDGVMAIDTPAADKEDTAPPVVEEPAAPAVVRAPAVESRIFSLYLVGNRYNPSNYWTGRWRANYVLDLAKGTLEGSAQVNIHYYEQGNVQLSTSFTASSPLPSTYSPAAVITLIKKSEASFHAQLSDAYASLADDTFKSLRRALPKTRSKLDWAKIAGYRLGSELGGAVPSPI